MAKYPTAEELMEERWILDLTNKGATREDAQAALINVTKQLPPEILEVALNSAKHFRQAFLACIERNRDAVLERAVQRVPRPERMSDSEAELMARASRVTVDLLQEEPRAFLDGPQLIAELVCAVEAMHQVRETIAHIKSFPQWNSIPMTPVRDAIEVIELALNG